jgi:5'-3' exonuclease
MEADDVIYSIASTFSGIKPVLIFARDNDIYQALTFQGVTMSEHFEPVTSENGEPVEPREFTLETFGIEKCQEKYKCLPHQLGLWKAFRGDSGDNIKGYPRIPTKFIEWIIGQDYTTPEEFFENPPHPDNLPRKTWEKWLQKILDEPDRLRKNYHLVKLSEVEVTLYQTQGNWGVFDDFQLWEVLVLFNEICGNPWELGACPKCQKKGRLKNNLCVNCFLEGME